MFFYSEDWKKTEILDVFDEFVYRKNYECPDGIVITRYEGDETRLIIPDSIDGKPVVGIGADAFCEADLTEVYLPEGVWRIGADAFAGQEKLISVHLPDSLRYIDSFAFDDCLLLEHINFPENLKKIGRAAFFGCPLKTVVLPDGLTVLGAWAFRDCKQLQYLRIPSGIKAFVDMESGDGDPVLEEMDLGRLESDFTGGLTVETFRFCSSLENIDFDYPVDIELAEGKRPLSRSALCQMFGDTPWLKKALDDYARGRFCGTVNYFPCLVEELFEITETADTIMLIGMKRKIDLNYFGCTVPKEFSGKRVFADESVFDLKETEHGYWRIEFKNKIQ